MRSAILPAASSATLTTRWRSTSKAEHGAIDRATEAPAEVSAAASQRRSGVPETSARVAPRALPPWIGTAAGVSCSGRWLSRRQPCRTLRHAARARCADRRLFTIAAALTLVIGIAGASVAVIAPWSTACCSGIPLPFGNPGPGSWAPWHGPPPLGAVAPEPQTASTYLALPASSRTRSRNRCTSKAGERSRSQEAGRRGDAGRMIDASLSVARPVLQARPLINRTFTDADDRPGAAPVMLISERMWRGRFRGDGQIIGRRLELDGVSPRKSLSHAGELSLPRGGDAAVDRPTRSRQSPPIGLRTLRHQAPPQAGRHHRGRGT